MGKRLPVVLLHGIRLSGSMWEPTAERLRDRRAAACPDLPGHGALHGERFTIDAALQVIEDSIDAVGGRAVVVGHSMGGYLAMATAARLQPKVAGVVAMGCTTQPSTRAKVVYEGVAKAAVKMPRAYDRLSAAIFRKYLPVESAAAFVGRGLSSEAFLDCVKAIETLDSLADVAAYAGPIWFINGTFDQMRLQEKKFLAAAHEGRLAIWPGLNHLSVMADPVPLARAIDDACLVVDAREE